MFAVLINHQPFDLNRKIYASRPTTRQTCTLGIISQTHISCMCHYTQTNFSLMAKRSFMLNGSIYCMILVIRYIRHAIITINVTTFLTYNVRPGFEKSN